MTKEEYEHLIKDSILKNKDNISNNEIPNFFRLIGLSQEEKEQIKALYNVDKISKTLQYIKGVRIENNTVILDNSAPPPK